MFETIFMLHPLTPFTGKWKINVGKEVIQENVTEFIPVWDGIGSVLNSLPLPKQNPSLCNVLSENPWGSTG